MAVANGAAIGAITGAAGAAANGGNVFKGALKGAFSGAVFGGAGGGAGLEGLLTEAVVGGTMSVIQGGKFGAGFLSAGFSRVAGGFVKGDSLRRAISTVIIGGTAARLGGGKFANGAATTAFSSIVSEAANEGFGLFTSNSGLEQGYQDSVSAHGSQDSSFKISDDLTLDYTTSGPDGFSDVVAGHLENLNSTATGREILTGLAESGNSIKIFRNVGQSAANSRGSFDFSWSGTTIAFDPNYVRAPAGLFVNSSGRAIRPLVSPTNVLGHELVHAWQNTSYFNGPPKISGNVSGKNPWEVQAVRYTNRIRQEQGLNYSRTRY